MGGLLGQLRVIRAVASLDRREFERLVFSFGREWIKAQGRSLSVRGTERIRALGAGRKGRLGSMRRKRLFILMYFKLYALEEVTGVLFGFNQWEATRRVHRLTPVLEKPWGGCRHATRRIWSGCWGNVPAWSLCWTGWSVRCAVRRTATGKRRTAAEKGSGTASRIRPSLPKAGFGD